jgi:hypothetical protein
MMFKSKCSARLFLGALVTAGCFIAFVAGAENAAPQACVTAPKSSLVVNVKDKGAKGDGQTEDTAAIQEHLGERSRATAPSTGATKARRGWGYASNTTPTTSPSAA